MPIQFPRQRPNRVQGLVRNLGTLGLKLSELRQRERVSGREADISARRATTAETQAETAAGQLTQRKREAGVSRVQGAETIALNRRKARLKEQEFEIENADRLPINTQATAKVDQTFANFGVTTPKSLTESLNTHIKIGSSRGDVHDSFEPQWDRLTEGWGDDVRKQYDKKVKDNPAFAGSPEAAQMLRFEQTLRADGQSKVLFNSMFSQTRTARAARTAEKAGFSAPFLRGDVEVQAGPTGRIVATPTKKAPAVPKGVPTQTQLAAAEEKILSDPTHPGNAAQARLFNKNTEEPAAYVEGKVEVPGRVFGTNTVDGWLKIEFASADEVKTAFDTKQITRDIAERLLKKHFGMN